MAINHILFIFIKENTLVDVTGFATPTKKGYVSFIVTDIKEHVSEDEEANSQNLELSDDDLPFLT